MKKIFYYILFLNLFFIKNIVPVNVYASEYTYEELSLITRLTKAEAEGQGELGQRYVIDVIFNRIEHESFPDTVNGVVYQKNQFTPTTNGRLKKCDIDNDILTLVLEEEASRTNNDVLFFNTGDYPSYGDPVCKVGDHYFTSL